jgi:ATP-dependent helicase HrpA
LTQAEQHRIFEKSSQRKIILSTNIAETSLTIPGIRFVIDSGFVRLSLYSPQTRTKRLPIQPHSQSSARQRQGRAGRVSEGVCIRLYSEVDFNNRLPYTPPEIQRSNLADVILRMLAFKLGHIESFPFIEPPQERFIKAGYQLLRELGAINEHHQLTPMGHQLANLPIDPTVGRIILEAKNKGVLGIVLVIAAALSIQDPRERPFDEQAKADASHKRFIHPESDFLTLWTIWQAYHDECEALSQRGLRKFCKSHYLSYIRMREWMDVYDQLKQALKDLHISVNEVVSLDALIISIGVGATASFLDLR